MMIENNMEGYKKIPQDEVPAYIKEVVDPEGPLSLRSKITQAISVMPSKDAVIALYILLDDPDRKIKEESLTTLFSLPDSILKPALADQSMHPHILEFFFHKMSPTDPARQIIIENPSVSDAILIEAANTSIPEHLEVIANNHKRAIKNNEILKALYNNPKMPQNVLMHLIENAQSYGIVMTDIPELDEKAEEPPIQQEDHLENTQEDIPQELLQDDEESETTEASFTNKSESDSTKGENRQLWERVKDMSMGHKIVLAQNGNKEARALLIRESNKVILRALVNNPRISEAEVLSLAQSRRIDEEIIRIISSNGEWMKSYKMKLALVRNPKTPFDQSRKLLLYLNKRDMKDLSKSKDIPSALATIAKKLFSQKSQ